MCISFNFNFILTKFYHYDIIIIIKFGGCEMGNTFYYIADGKAYLHRDGKEFELRSMVLESYIEKVKESAKRNEWKYSGTGAAFTNTY